MNLTLTHSGFKLFDMEKKCIVIGAGVIGHFTAYYLAQAGHQVVLIDESDISDGCSFGNAGMVVPSHIIPMAQPGMISKGIRWMFNSTSPFYVKPRLSNELIQWSWKFYKNATKEHVEQSIAALRDISLFSKSLYKDLAKERDVFGFKEHGLLMLFQTEKVAEEELAAAEVAKRAGLKVKTYDKNELNKIETNTAVKAIGAIHYEQDAHLDPTQLMTFLKSEIKRLNVSILSNCIIKSIQTDGKIIKSLHTNLGSLEADEFIVCAGSWTPDVLKKLDIPVSILPGKGYSFNFEKVKNSPSIPSILCEGKVAVTPMGNKIRFGGTLELTHVRDTSVNQKRIEGIMKSMRSFYPDLEMQTIPKDKIWKGFRPCTPTGLPIITRNERFINLIIASGHGMMGLSLAPATGKLVEQLVSEVKTEISVERYRLV